MTTSDRIKDMTTRLRTMAVLCNGVWQKGEGVWIDIGNYKARVILHGKELICDGKHFEDLDGCEPKEITLRIMNRNIATLPKLQRKNRVVELKPIRPLNVDSYYRNYRIINRNGRAHAVPYPSEIPNEEQLRRLEEFREDRAAIEGNNV